MHSQNEKNQFKTVVQDLEVTWEQTEHTLDPQRVKASILIVCDDILLLVSLLQVFPLTFE